MRRKLLDFRRADDSNDFKYSLDYGKVNSSFPKPAILLIGGAEEGTVGEDAATQWFLKRAYYPDYLVLRCGRIGRQAQWIKNNYKELIN